jgi:hypothetical protein
MSEPDDPRWLNAVGEELRREVPVRAAWRANLLEDLARSAPPSPLDEPGIDPTLSTETPRHRGRRIVLSPFAGIAAAALAPRWQCCRGVLAGTTRQQS